MCVSASIRRLINVGVMMMLLRWSGEIMAGVGTGAELKTLSARQASAALVLKSLKSVGFLVRWSAIWANAQPTGKIKRGPMWARVASAWKAFSGARDIGETATETPIFLDAQRL